MNKAAFLDVNGVIVYNNCNKKDGAYYLLKPEDIIFIPGVGDAHKLLLDNCYYIFWITSQDSITEKLITRTKITRMFNAMERLIGAYCEVVNTITETAIVTNDVIGDDSDPEIQALKASAKDIAMQKLIEKYDVDVNKSFGVGDRSSDIDSYDQVGLKYKYQIILPYGDPLVPKADDNYPDLLSCVLDHITKYN